VAARQRPRGAIGVAVSSTSPRRLLVVVSRPLEEEPAAIREIAVAAGRSGDAAEVMVLSPARIRFLDRWASDVEGARREAQQRLVITVASLAKVGVAAEARVGDEDLVQAVEDQLQSFAATTVILVGPATGEDPTVDVAATELEQRLRAEFRRLVVSGSAAR
jgi:predicted TIM-barrel enzyme